MLADATDPSKNFAVCSLSAAAFGMPGIEPGRARYLRILQGIQWPYDRKHGGQRYEPDAKGTENWNPTRVLGTVPLEADGSAHFKVPADQAVYFQLLDENQMELRRMPRSSASSRASSGRAWAATRRGPRPARRPLPRGHAARRGRSRAAPLGHLSHELPPRRAADLRPALPSCHSGMKPAKGLDFSGGLTSVNGRTRNVAYDTIFAHNLVARSNVNDDARIRCPWTSARTKQTDRVVGKSPRWTQLEQRRAAAAGHVDRFERSLPRPLHRQAAGTCGLRPARPTPNWKRRSSPSMPRGAGPATSRPR